MDSSLPEIILYFPFGNAFCTSQKLEKTNATQGTYIKWISLAQWEAAMVNGAFAFRVTPLSCPAILIWKWPAVFPLRTGKVRPNERGLGRERGDGKEREREGGRGRRGQCNNNNNKSIKETPAEPETEQVNHATSFVPWSRDGVKYAVISAWNHNDKGKCFVAFWDEGCALEQNGQNKKRAFNG